MPLPLAAVSVSPTLVSFCVYLLATVAIGLWAARRGKDDEEDYFLGGRSLSALSMALSAVSSGRSAWLVMGASAAAWAQGLSAMWMFPGYILAEAWMFRGLGPRLRERSIEVDAITIPEVLARAPLGKNFVRGHSSLPVQRVAGIIVVLFLTTYVSSQLTAGAKALDYTLDIEGETTGLAISASIVLAYTLLGGYRAVVVTDVVQAVLMLLGLVVLPLSATMQLGGFGELGDRLRAIDPTLLHPFGGAAAFLGGLALGFGSPGQPHILVRHMSLRDPSEARQAMVAGTLWNTLMAAGALLMGLVGRTLYPALENLAGKDDEGLFITLAADFSSQFLFQGALGILIAALFAAVMSTCDSQLLVVASSALRDVLGRKAKPETTRRWRGRIAVALTLCAAVLLHVGDLPQVHVFVLLSWSALGASFGPALILALYDPRMTSRGVFAAMLVGVLGILATHFWWVEAGEHISWHLGVVFLAALAVGWSLRERLPKSALPR